MKLCECGRIVGTEFQRDQDVDRSTWLTSEVCIMQILMIYQIFI